MKKSTKIIFCVVLSVVLLVGLLLGGVYLWSKLYFYDFYSNSQRTFTIPGLNSGFIPQGFEYLADSETFLVSGYMKDTSQPSRVYVIPPEGDRTCVELLTADGEAYTGHCGGIAVQGEYVYLSSEGELSVFSLTDILSGGQAKQIGAVPTDDRVSFCTFVDGYLLIGTFYYPEYYETPEKYHVTTPSGDENPSLIWIYQADEQADFGIDPSPVAALSVREKVQGVAINDQGQVILSTSWGMASSTLWLYDIDERVGQIDGIPLYYLDSESLVASVKAPPMAEEMVYLDGKLYIMTESACTKYIFGNFIDARRVYAYEF